MNPFQEVKGGKKMIEQCLELDDLEKTPIFD
jgi:hypothetical protein